MSVSDELLTHPSPNPLLTLTCYQLTVVGIGEGRGGWAGWADVQVVTLISVLFKLCYFVL